MAGTNLHRVRLDRIALITALAERDMRQAELAAAAGISRNTISGICSGRRCTNETADKIAGVLKIDKKKLLSKA